MLKSLYDDGRWAPDWVTGARGPAEGVRESVEGTREPVEAPNELAELAPPRNSALAPPPAYDDGIARTPPSTRHDQREPEPAPEPVSEPSKTAEAGIAVHRRLHENGAPRWPDGANDEIDVGMDAEPFGDEIIVERDQDRAVKRRLRGINIFMITISGVLGVGLYVRGGIILRLGGPLALLVCFAAVGFLAWAVMQCIAEMLCIWPISSALTVYVSEFVDEELGIAVGVAYWFTYSISFAALIAATAAESNFWGTPKGIQGGVLFFLIPVVLIIINALGVEWYGWFEVVGGSLKLTFLFVIIVAMLFINCGAGSQDIIGTSRWAPSVTVYDTEAANTWVAALMMSLSIAAFAFVGVEIPAASALEARVPTERDPSTKGAVGRTVKFSAIWIPFFTTVIYIFAGILISLNIEWNDPKLPRLSWLASQKAPSDSRTPGTTDSAFILAAQMANIPGLAAALNVFLMFTALTCANTNLYVASRALFGLTRSLDGDDQPLYIRALAWLGKTNNRKVPLRALIASCIFSFIPFLYLSPANGPGTSINTILDVLSEMGSVGVVVVWACEVWAFIRFRHCVMHHEEALRSVSMVRRWNKGTNDLPDDYPYRSHGQPLLAYFALFSCLFILLVANSASLWKEFHYSPFLSTYLAPICFLILWALLKFIRKAPWKLVDLSNGPAVAKKMKRLHEIRFRSAQESGNNYEMR